MKLVDVYEEYGRRITRGTIHILGDSVESKHGVLRLNVFSEDDFELFNEITNSNKITIVLGARRTGKTQLLQNLVEYNLIIKPDLKVIYACSDMQQAERYRKELTDRLHRFVTKSREGRITLCNRVLIRFIYNDMQLRGCSTDYDYILFDDNANKNLYTDTSVFLEYMMPVIDGGKIVICLGNHTHYEILTRELYNKGINFQEVKLHGNQAGGNLQREEWYTGKLRDLLKEHVSKTVQGLRRVRSKDLQLS